MSRTVAGRQGARRTGNRMKVFALFVSFVRLVVASPQRTPRAPSQNVQNGRRTAGGETDGQPDESLCPLRVLRALGGGLTTKDTKSTKPECPERSQDGRGRDGRATG